MSVPPSPTAHVGDALPLDTPCRLRPTDGLMYVQFPAPLKWIVVPSTPTAQTLLAEVPPTASSSFVVLLFIAVHVVPLYW